MCIVTSLEGKVLGLTSNIIVLSDSAKYDYGSARPSLLLAEKLSLDGFRVFFVSSSIGPSIREKLTCCGAVPVDLRFKEIFKDASKNMFLSWSFENFFRFFARRYKEAVFSNVNDVMIVLNFSSFGIVDADVWYAQGPFFSAFSDIDWRSYPFHYFVLSKYLSPFVRFLDLKHVRDMKKSSKFIIANSRFTASMYRDLGVKVDFVIYPPLDTGLFKPSTNNPVEDYILTYIGKETDFRVLNVIAKKGVKIYAFGSKEQILPEPLRRNCFFIFLGRVSIESLVDLYSNALFTLFPFTHEPFGYIPVESMACGTPVLTYSKHGPSETVIDGKTGWLAKNRREIVDLALKIWREGYSKELRRNSRERALKFDIIRIYSIWKKVLNLLIL